MSYQQQWKLGLALVSCLITALLCWPIYLLKQDLLLTLTSAMAACFVCAYLSFHFYKKNVEPFEQLKSFIQLRKQEKQNITLNFDNPNSPFAEVSQLLQQDLYSAQTPEGDVLQSILSEWQYPVLMFDKQEKIVFFNQALLQLFSSPILIGMKISDLSFYKRQGQYNNEQLAAHWSLQNVRFKQQDLILFHDIEQSLKNQKLKTQTDTIRILSHELNNSLTPMASMADTLLSSDSFSESLAREVLQRVKSRSESLLEFIGTYTRLNKTQQIKPSWFDVQNVCQQLSIEQGIDCHTAGNASIFADPILFEQVLENLMKNAKQAQAQKLQINILSQGSLQIIELADDGIGFSNIDNLSVPLYTTKKDGQGLGLFFCRQIIELHNGKLDFSNSDNGAKVTISLPTII
ncbi:sensor histidine kinase [Parashewanella curva]|uniref:histidine kinase n=1 Tax=Parashewanella curva TaxID=2338552 RepID=A0A3L8PWV5_9GAMM|nr:HAMP domain-containing sensor histidine kinase [Parashewanella curva]RLV59800.1 sensor histidine kinase [Parashewanella curva]